MRGRIQMSCHGRKSQFFLGNAEKENPYNDRSTKKKNDTSGTLVGEAPGFALWRVITTELQCFVMGRHQRWWFHLFSFSHGKLRTKSPKVVPSLKCKIDHKVDRLKRGPCCRSSSSIYFFDLSFSETFPPSLSISDTLFWFDAPNSNHPKFSRYTTPKKMKDSHSVMQLIVKWEGWISSWSIVVL